MNDYWCIPSKEDADFVACMGNAARRQQYEHYRDKLLTFKRKGAA